jgi:hypothetical protein
MTFRCVKAQMLLYALKDDIDPDGPEARRAISDIKRAVKAHNRKFDSAGHPNTYRQSA